MRPRSLLLFFFIPTRSFPPLPSDSLRFPRPPSPLSNTEHYDTTTASHVSPALGYWHQNNTRHYHHQHTGRRSRPSGQVPPCLLAHAELAGTSCAHCMRQERASVLTAACALGAAGWLSLRCCLLVRCHQRSHQRAREHARVSTRVPMCRSCSMHARACLLRRWAPVCTCVSQGFTKLRECECTW